jgi:hypothetical protein
LRLKKEFLEDLKPFFTNMNPNITIEIPINKLSHANIVSPEMSIELILKSSNMPFDRNIIPNTP